MAGYRDVIRATWMNQSGVCYWSHHPQEGCSVYVAFVMGKGAAGDAGYGEQGALVLDIEENMNAGKSAVWMSTAQRLFPWASHYGKMDMDTYPFAHKLVARMAANRSCVQAASDYEWIGRPVSWGPLGWFQGACAERDCLGRFSSEVDTNQPGQRFDYMLGELYIMSRALVRGIPWRPVEGTEDRIMGDFVGNFSREQGRCVAVRRLDSDAHLPRRRAWVQREQGGRVNEEYANNLDAGHFERPAAEAVAQT